MKMISMKLYTSKTWDVFTSKNMLPLSVRVKMISTCKMIRMNKKATGRYGITTEGSVGVETAEVTRTTISAIFIWYGPESNGTGYHTFTVDRDYYEYIR